MKKSILFICFVLCISLWNNAFAELYCPEDWGECYEVTPLKEESGKGETSNWQSAIKVKVPEKVPGANCGEKDAETWLYECSIKPGFKSVQGIIGNIIKWFTAIAALSWVLFIVVNGIMLSTGSETGEIKKRIIGGIIWLILVLLSGVILNMIAPWVYK